MPGSKGLTAEQRFWKYVDKNGPVPEHCPELGRCWEWIGALDKDGYGEFGWKKQAKIKKAHRAAYKLFKADYDPKLWVLHKCDRRSCVNPDHLFHGTSRDNIDDMVSKERTLRGERNHWSKLTEENVREILRRYIPRKSGTPSGTRGPCPNSVRSLAREFGTSKCVIQSVLKGRTWKHVTTTYSRETLDLDISCLDSVR